jgi:hypothetical protein
MVYCSYVYQYFGRRRKGLSPGVSESGIHNRQGFSPDLAIHSESATVNGTSGFPRVIIIFRLA